MRISLSRHLAAIVGGTLVLLALAGLHVGGGYVEAASNVAFVQSASLAQTSGRTASKAFNSNVASGHLLVVGVFVDLGATVSVTDSLGDSFTQVAHQSVATDHDADVFVSTAASSAPDTITVNAGSGKNTYAFSLHEYSGATTTVDAMATAQGNSSAPASGNLTTATPNDLLFVWFTNGSNFQNENFSSLSSSYTRRELSGTGLTQCYAFANCLESADQFTTANITTSATASLSAADVWSATVVAFKGVQVSDTTPPSVPANLAVTGTTTSSVSLSWTASTDNVGVAGYKIYRAGTQVGSTGSTSYSDTALAPSTTYSYTVSAFDAAGNNSAQSAAVQATTQTPVDSTPPTVPANLAVTGTTASSVSLSWTASTDNVGVAGYKIYRAGTQVGSTGSTSYSDTALAPSTTYSYTVSAFDAAGNNSAQSPAVQGTTLPAAPTISSFAANPTTILAGQTSTLSWTVSGATSLSLDNGIGNVTGKTSIVVSPAATTTYTLTATNTGGPATAQTTVTVSSDTTPPTVSITAPVSGVTVSSTVPISATASDNVAVASVTFKVDGAAIATDISSPYSANWDSTTVTNGAHTITATATDTSNNQTTSTAVTVTVNNSSPQPMAFIQSASGTQPGGRTASKAFNSNVASGHLLVVGVFVDLGATVSVTDSLGDSFAQVAHQSVATDHDADVFVSTAASSAPDTITVNAGSGKNTYAFSLHEYSGATTTVDAMATAQGNSSAPASGNLTTATPNDLLFAWFTNGSNFQNENFSSLSSSYTRRELSGTGLTQCYAFANCLESADLFTTANITTSATASLNAPDIWSATVVAFKGVQISDTTPPSVPANLAVTGTTTSSVSLSWTASTDNVGVAGYKIYRAGTQVGSTGSTSYSDTALAPSTTYSYTVSAFDAAGNNSAQSAAVQATTQTPVDSTPPTVPANLAVTGTTASSVSLSWTASTDNVGVAGYKIYRAGTQVGSTGSTSYSDTALAPSTTYSYTVSAFDAAGNNSAQSPAVQGTTLPAAPTISSFAANPTTILAGQTSTLSWTVSGATSLSLDNGIGNVTGKTSIVVSPAATTTYTLTATNTGGPATAQTTVTVSSDTTPPTVSITAPVSGVTVSSTVPISATASDNVAVASVTFKVDGAAIATDISSPYSANWDSTTVTNGAHTITATATDTSNNQTTSTAVTVTVNNSSPQPMAFIQSASGTQPGGRTASKAFNSNVASGHLLVVGVFVDLGATVSVTDSLGDSFAQVAHQSVATDHDADVFVSTAASSAPDTITVNAGSGKNTYAFSLHEYSGATTTVDAMATAQGNSSAPASGNLTTATPNDLLFAWFTNGSNFQNENFSSLSSSYTRRELSGTGLTQCYAFANCLESADLFTTANITTSATASLNAPDIWSATVVAFKGVQISDTTPPSVPANLAVTGTTASSVSLSWTASTDNVGVAGYRIFRNGTVIATRIGTSFTDTGLTASTTYTYTVAAFDASSNVSAQSSPAIAATLAQDNTPPSVPTGLHAIGVTSTNITLSWTASTDNVGVAGYEVFRSGAQVGMTASTTYTDLPLTPSTAYSYTLAAFDASGNVSAITNPAVVVTTSAGTALPLKASGNGRYLTDQNGSPIYVIGDSPHSLLVNLDSATMASYMADRQARGFNAILVQVLCNPYTGGYSSGTTYDGVAPFNSGNSPSNYDLSQPNPAYFARLDSLITMAATYNLTVFLDPIDTGGWMTTLENNGTARAFNYGAFLGSRYTGNPNIVWDSGNDFNDWNTNATDNNLVAQVMAGIASADSKHLQTVEINALASFSTQDPLLVPYVGLNSVYTYFPTYDMVLQAYNAGAGIPVFMTEANYEFENNVSAGVANAFVIREQEYWTLFSGGTSQLYGNHYTWTFDGPEGVSNWQSFLDSPGAMQIQYFTGLLQGLSWWNLVPDTNHVVVTGGYGTYDASNENLPTNTYSPTAWVIDGSLAMTYDVTGSSVTVNMTAFKSAVTARWYDPTNGSYIAITGSPFANSGSTVFMPPGSNSSGDTDWVLVLQAPGF